MGQKVNPIGFRLGVNKDWDSKWYADGKDYVNKLNNDIKIREYLEKKLKDAAVSKILIERKNDRVDVKIFTAKPGVIIGHGGEDIEKLRKEVKNVSGENVFITINDIKNPDLDASLVAQSIARQIENRGNYHNIQKKAIRQTLRAGALGVKTQVSGRLGGAEMARTEHYVEGTVPLQTIRADIDYAEATALTTYGDIGVKVWIYKGEILNKKNNTENTEDKKDNKEKKVFKKGGNDDVNAKKN